MNPGIFGGFLHALSIGIEIGFGSGRDRVLAIMARDGPKPRDEVHRWKAHEKAVRKGGRAAVTRDNRARIFGYKGDGKFQGLPERLSRDRCEIAL